MLKKKITKEESLEVNNLITEHHKYYVNDFGNTLVPKHHHQLHYYDCILIFGPLTNIWAIRTEAKHSDYNKLGKKLLWIACLK